MCSLQSFAAPQLVPELVNRLPSVGNLADHFNYDDGAGNGTGLYDASEVGRGASSDE